VKMEMEMDMSAVGVEREVEVSAKAQRRRFTAEYKRRILKETEGCRKPGELGALLRREGLYTSHLSAWRSARARGELAGLTPRRRGPKPRRPDPNARRILELEGEVRRLRARAERAEALVDVQKKLSQLLGIELPGSNGER
jgi:transposase